eukprot:1864099-Pyramimonas_sp.AAC.1
MGPQDLDHLLKPDWAKAKMRGGPGSSARPRARADPAASSPRPRGGPRGPARTDSRPARRPCSTPRDALPDGDQHNHAATPGRATVETIQNPSRPSRR